MNDKKTPPTNELETLRRQNAEMLQLFKVIMENGAWYVSAYEIDMWPDGPDGEDIGEKIEAILAEAGIKWERK